ncbi:efflux RND transporter periplasmic adaptor subunit [Spirosoma sp. KUDC1026]|uniref:efflux RND transporter periplasmic adaptor subunit n=1 Tax=Spirosoma sp. KUDC1026 TaxID=2745947 RepID=UPI00159BD615|nr:efflux RND transporter periplasmic adaptor subunit [Spirosoma sp. KUDC1026]QKZ14303.1 efflux RND transporter periplasmic adaptor subunit [Spirosoma sp. KUDC1026]
MFTKQVLTTCVVGLLAVGCTDRKTGAEQPDEKLTLPVVAIKRHNTALHREYVSTLEAVQNVEIRARVSGFLEKIHVDEGQPVRRGQLLFTLNAAEYRAEVDKAKAAYKNAVANARTAEVEVERVKLLIAKNIVSKTDLDLAQAKLESARAQIDDARSAQAMAALRVAQASIRAPFDGIINRIPLKMGSLIEEGTLLTTVSDLNEVFAYFDVSEREYLGFIKNNRDLLGKGAKPVEMLLADESLYPHKGRIEVMESVFEDGAGTIAFRARFPNPKHLLKHGSSGKVRLENVMDKALLVPQQATFEVQDKNYVYVVDQNNRVKSRSFVPQGRTGPYYLVRSGLEPGDRVVYEGIQNIRDGAQIVPRTISTDSLYLASAPPAQAAMARN